MEEVKNKMFEQIGDSVKASLLKKAAQESTIKTKQNR